MVKYSIIEFTSFSIIQNQKILGVNKKMLCNFTIATSQVTVPQGETSQMCIFPRGNFLKIRLGLLSQALLLALARGTSAAAREGQGAERWSQNRLGKLPPQKLHIQEVLTQENALGKLQLGKMPLENLTSTYCF